MTTMRRFAPFFLLSSAIAGQAMAESPAETAAMFGVRAGVQQLSLSPDGSKIAFLVPAAGQGSTLYTVSTAEGATPTPALAVDGKPDRLKHCHWVSETRLVCTVYGAVKAPDITLPVPYDRLFAVDARGGNQKLLSNVAVNHQGAVQDGGEVIDWLPGQEGKIMMARDYQRTTQIGTNIGSNRDGLGVDIIDTRTNGHDLAEPPRRDAIEYITDGVGNVRIAGFRATLSTGLESGVVKYQFHPVGSRDWVDLGAGFNPYAVDAKRNVAYGFRKLNGRLALYEKTLDARGEEKLLLSRPDVDVDDLVRIGRSQRVVGASYATDVRQVEYFDPEIKAIADALHRALPNQPLITIADASTDERKLLIFASSDTDSGRYYLFDRDTKRLQVLMLKRPELENKPLAPQKSVTYTAADGTRIPAYLTLPRDGPQKGLPAIVLPHGGPASRDEWGFDWLPQYFAARGYAVIQPNFRGSSGYSDSWFQQNGFKSWRTAIGDVADAGKWLIAEGIADPKRLVGVGWSYGGYAVLQTAVVQPDLFKVVVAIAPVTDLAALKEQGRGYTDFRLQSDFIGSDVSVVRDGSPAQNAARIKVPVLLAHGTDDRNVAYGESTLLQGKLQASGGKVELLTFSGLDHQLEDSAARTRLLERSDSFIREAIGQ